MFFVRFCVFWLVLGGLACQPRQVTRSDQKLFYKNQHVRQCLQYEKDKKTTESLACWSRLLRKLEEDPGFRAQAELTESDLAKIRKNIQQTDRLSRQLETEREKCLDISPEKRSERIACFQNFLSSHQKQLSHSERFETENAIQSLHQSVHRASGNVEGTIEHAGKLLGATLHEEGEGIRIDTIENGILRQVETEEQSMIVAIDDQLLSELSSTERISILEACEDRPIQLLFRRGEIGTVVFSRVEARCFEPKSAQLKAKNVLQEEICSEEKSPELKLGISLCYLPRHGVLEIEEVCADSPAAQSGVRPGQTYTHINEIRLLGKTHAEIGDILSAFPAQPLTFQEQTGTLESPSPVQGPALSEDRQTRCWEAIRATLRIENK